MKGLICYYSGTGNTLLACRYLAKKVTAAEWTFFDILRDPTPDYSAYDVVGFATFTDYWSVPQRMLQFLKTVPEQKGRPAFLFMTHGMFLVLGMRDLGRAVRKRGFKTVAGIRLHTPENYPPIICAGLPFAQSPNEKELAGFHAALRNLDSLLRAGRPLKNTKPGENALNALLPSLPRAMGRWVMGRKRVDQSLCVKCGTCEKGCPYHAITLAPYPRFDQKSCYGCWVCYNRCPRQAIYTAQYRSRGRHPKPLPQFADKLS